MGYDGVRTVYKCAFIKALAPLCVQVAPRRKKSFPHDATFPQKSNIRIDCKINSPYFTIGTNLLGVSLDSRFQKLVRYRCFFIKCFILLSIKPKYDTNFDSILLLLYLTPLCFEFLNNLTQNVVKTLR